MTGGAPAALALLIGLGCGGGAGGNGTGGAGAGGGTAGAGSGGTGAAGGQGGAGAGGAGTGGTGGCGVIECLRAYECVASCGGPVQSSGCCPCAAPLFDRATGCADAGTPAVSYLGCTFVGGIDRFVIAKRDTARNLCFNVVLDAPGTVPAGLTLPANLGLEWASVGPASACPTRVPSSARATATGQVTQMAGGLGTPTALDVDVTLDFAADAAPSSEALSAHAVDVTPACQ
ncbi:MAG TPA: hypothetical protein VKZ18_04540 [Polyangia bacterium]|nr:hypothetical protein [Polyangia bacterium]